YRQDPGMETGIQRLERGKEVDLFYRSAENFDFEEYMMESLALPTPDLTGKSPEDVFEILRENSMILGRETFEDNVPDRRARVYKQDPDPEDIEKVVKGTTFDIWYKDVDDLENQEDS
ncbi:MAG: PASTA domain-containing protein, partial [Bacteroidota bacterium]